MNSEVLRKIAQEQQDGRNQLEKDKRVSQYENYIQEVKYFVAKNHDLFLNYLNDQIVNEVSIGKLTCILSRTEYEGQITIAFGNLSASKYIWEEFFRKQNNPYLSDWAVQNKIYLTIKKRKKHVFDFVDWIDDFIFSLSHPSYPNSAAFNQFEWTIFIDARKHSRVYKLLRSLFYDNTYYHYSLRHGSKCYKAMKKSSKIKV